MTYNAERANQAYEKFNQLVEIWLNSLQKKVENLTKRISNKETIDKIQENPNLETILDSKSTLIDLNPSFSEKFKIIEFFVSNDIPDVEQVHIAINSIVESDFIKEFSSKIADEITQKQIYETRIASIKQVLKNLDSEFDNFVSLINTINLTNEEKILILSKLALESCVPKKNTKDKKESKEEKENTKEPIKKEKPIKPYQEHYEKLTPHIKEIISKYYKNIDGKTKKQLEEEKNLANSYKLLQGNKEHTPSEIDNEIYIKATINTALSELIEYKKEVESILQNNPETISIDTAEELSLYIQEIENNLNTITEIEKKSSKEPVTDKDKNSTSLIFLLDEDETPTFDLNKMDQDDKKRIKALINKLSNEDSTQLKARIVKGLNLDFDIYENYSSDMCCTYVKLNDSTILILNFADEENVFDESRALGKKYAHKIQQLRENPELTEKEINNPIQIELLNQIQENGKRKINN